MDNNSCIRVFADVNQINACKQLIAGVEPQIEELASVLSLAGNGARLKMLYLMSKESKVCVCDISDILGMTVAAVSQHLRKLKDGRMVESNKVGSTIFYSLNKEKLSILKPLFKQIEKMELVK